MIVTNYRNADGSILLAVVITGTKRTEGIEFPTPSDCPIQVGVISWGPGHLVAAHYHPPTVRTLTSTTEVLMLTRGSAELRLWDNVMSPAGVRQILPGDIVVILSGGHELTAGEDGFDAVECKTGPYLGAQDKIRFDPSLWGQIDCS